MSKSFSQPLAQRWVVAIHHAHGLSAPWQKLVRKLGEDVIDGQICHRLSAQESTSVPDTAVAVVNSAKGIRTDAPLVLDGDLLYFHRHWDCQQRLVRGLWRLCCLAPLAAPLAATVQWPPDRSQAAALRAALTRHLTIITGPPGSGKTHILKSLSQAIGEKKVVFTAPTGKAAQRICEVIPACQALTLHKLLRLRSDSATPYFHSRRRLDLQVLVVDEASMVSLEMMTMVVEALPDDAQLILLGDADQLPSVQAGSILADMLGTVPLQPYIARLETSYRQQHGIAQLANLVRAGHEEAVMELLNSHPGDVTWIAPEQLQGAVQEVVQPFAQLCGRDDLAREELARKLLLQLQQQRILCATNHDIARINAMVRRHFAILHNPDHGWPLSITANGRELANGDVGVTLGTVGADLSTVPTAYFLSSGSEQLRAYPRNQLTAAQSTWAMTVHRSQGSEFSRVLVVLPPSHFPAMLRRSLLYTALTRAREHVTLCASEEALRCAVRTDDRRTSGSSGSSGLSAAFQRIAATAPSSKRTEDK